MLCLLAHWKCKTNTPLVVFDRFKSLFIYCHIHRYMYLSYFLATPGLLNNLKINSKRIFYEWAPNLNAPNCKFANGLCYLKFFLFPNSNLIILTCFTLCVNVQNVTGIFYWYHYPEYSVSFPLARFLLYISDALFILLYASQTWETLFVENTLLNIFKIFPGLSEGFA